LDEDDEWGFTNFGQKIANAAKGIGAAVKNTVAFAAKASKVCKIVVTSIIKKQRHIKQNKQGKSASTE
jgi:hypothetical protein